MFIEPARLMTASLASAPWGEKAARIMAAALEAVDPEESVRRRLRRDGDRLFVEGRAYDLSRFRKVWVVGAGKAGAPMAKAVEGILGSRLSGGLVIVKHGHALQARESSGRIRILEAGHPVPDLHGVQATRRLVDLIGGCRHDDLALCLISGGGSALLTYPVPEVTLAQLQQLTTDLLASGADIREINTLRKHLDLVKGGGLARLAAPAQTVTLVLSDVIGDPLDVIASGPTAPDPTTFGDALAVLEKYGLAGRTVPAILERLESGRRGETPETPKPGDPLFERVQVAVVGSNSQAARAALEQAGAEGMQALLLSTTMQGEARQAGRLLAALAQQLAFDEARIKRPACLVCGGETTVTLAGNGMGGRNQELALGAVEGLAGLKDVALAALATDGGDGPSDAAGAVATGETLQRASLLGLNPSEYLANNDSYHFFQPLGDLLKPGPTLTNVNDLAFLFAF